MGMRCCGTSSVRRSVGQGPPYWRRHRVGFSPPSERPMPITPQEALQRTIEHREIFHDEMIDLMRQIMRGEVSPPMVAALITGLRVKKETVGEITAAATVMRELASRVETPRYEHFID